MPVLGKLEREDSLRGVRVEEGACADWLEEVAKDLEVPGIDLVLHAEAIEKKHGFRIAVRVNKTRAHDVLAERAHERAEKGGWTNSRNAAAD